MLIEKKLLRIMEIGQEMHECRSLEWQFESYWYHVRRGHCFSARDLEERILESADRVLALWIEFNEIVDDIEKHTFDSISIAKNGNLTFNCFTGANKVFA